MILSQIGANLVMNISLAKLNGFVEEMIMVLIFLSDTMNSEILNVFQLMARNVLGDSEKERHALII